MSDVYRLSTARMRRIEIVCDQAFADGFIHTSSQT